MMFRARDVRMRQLIDDGYFGLAGDDGVNVHLLYSDATVFDLAHRDAFQVTHHRFGVRAPVRLYERRDNVHALLFKLMGVFEHLICFTYARRSADVNAQLRPLALLEFGEE